MKVRVDLLRRRLGLPATADRSTIAAALAASIPGIETHEQHMRRVFPAVAAKLTARRQVRALAHPSGQGYGDTWPGTTGPKQRPASLDQPPAPGQVPSLTGPATTPIPSTTTTIPMQSVPAVTPEDRHTRRIGGFVRPDRPRIDLTAPAPGSTIEKTFTWT